MRKALKFTQQLESVGFTRSQAQTQVEILGEAMEDGLASKADVQNLAGQVHAGVQQLERKIATDTSRLEAKIEAEALCLEGKINAEIKRLEAKIEAEIQRLDAKIDLVKAELKGEILALRTEMIAAMDKLQDKVTIRLGIIVTVVISAVETAFRIWGG